MTSKKADRQLDNVNVKYPEKVAAICQSRFPATIKIDTATRTEYDFIEVMCDDRIIYRDQLKTDTFVKYVKKVMAAPVRFVTITRQVEDSTKVYQCQLDVQYWQGEAKKEKTAAARHIRLSRILGVLSALLLLLIFVILKNK